jgi:hypothetical protein
MERTNMAIAPEHPAENGDQQHRDVLAAKPFIAALRRRCSRRAAIAGMAAPAVRRSGRRDGPPAGAAPESHPSAVYSRRHTPLFGGTWLPLAISYRVLARSERKRARQVRAELGSLPFSSDNAARERDGSHWTVWWNKLKSNFSMVAQCSTAGRASLRKPSRSGFAAVCA